MSTATAIPVGSKVLVTGANGYIAAYISDHLLKAGYRVRGTVRSAYKAAYLEEVFNARYPVGSFEYVVVPDMAKEGGFDEAMEGIAGVVHVATNASFSSDADVVINETVNGVRNTLHTVAKHASVKRFVYTSSAAAMALDVTQNLHLDESSWNDAAIDLAHTMPDAPEKGAVVYAASKTLAERECFDFVKKEHPKFIVNTVVPFVVAGEILHPKQAASTAGLVKGMFLGMPQQVAIMKQFTGSGGLLVDVKDVARLHVAGLTEEDVRGERLIAGAEQTSFNTILEAMDRVPASGKVPERMVQPKSGQITVEVERSTEMLKRLGGAGWVPMQQTIDENCMSEWDSSTFKFFT